MKFLLVLTSAIIYTSAANLPSNLMSALPQNEVGGGRIVGGEKAVDGEFPWMVSIRTVGTIGSTHFCGGTIIDKDWILTAGYCCTYTGSALTMHVIAGGIKLNSFEDEEEPRSLDHLILHPNYDGHGSDGSDVCLMKLKESLEWTESVQPIALPELHQETEAGTDCTVIGWGQLTNDGMIGHTNVLHKVTVPVVSEEDCKMVFANTKYNIIESMICAGEEGKDECQGDTGGPLVGGEPGSEELLGVVSWGIRQYACGEKFYPGVYTEVSYFIDWIRETLAAY